MQHNIVTCGIASMRNYENPQLNVNGNYFVEVLASFLRFSHLSEFGYRHSFRVSLAFIFPQLILANFFLNF